MTDDPLTLKYLLLTLLAIWGILVVVAAGRNFRGVLLGTGLFLIIAYLSLGSGFSIRIPYHHDKMELLVYTLHEARVHALAQPLNESGDPIHIVFSIDRETPAGARMRKSFFDALRAHEEKPQQTRIIVDMRGYMTALGEYRHEIPPALPPKLPR